MEKRSLTCIRCPRGCQIEAVLDAGEVLSLTGNACKREEVYARAEITSPVRTVTTTIPVKGSARARMLSVKTAREVPKEKVFDVIRALSGVCAQAPVSIGDVVLADVAATGVDVVATMEA